MCGGWYIECFIVLFVDVILMYVLVIESIELGFKVMVGGRSIDGVYFVIVKR